MERERERGEIAQKKRMRWTKGVELKSGTGNWLDAAGKRLWLPRVGIKSPYLEHWRCEIYRCHRLYGRLSSVAPPPANGRGGRAAQEFTAIQAAAIVLCWNFYEGGCTRFSDAAFWFLHIIRRIHSPIGPMSIFTIRPMLERVVPPTCFCYLVMEVLFLFGAIRIVFRERSASVDKSPLLQ